MAQYCFVIWQLTVHKHDQCIIVLSGFLHLNLGICFNSTFQLDEPNYLDISAEVITQL